MLSAAVVIGALMAKIGLKFIVILSLIFFCQRNLNLVCEKSGKCQGVSINHFFMNPDVRVTANYYKSENPSVISSSKIC